MNDGKKSQSVFIEEMSLQGVFKKSDQGKYIWPHKGRTISDSPHSNPQFEGNMDFAQLTQESSSYTVEVRPQELRTFHVIFNKDKGTEAGFSQI